MVLALYICGLTANVAVGVMARAAAGVSVRAAARAAARADTKAAARNKPMSVTDHGYSSPIAITVAR